MFKISSSTWKCFSRACYGDRYLSEGASTLEVMVYISMAEHANDSLCCKIVRKAAQKPHLCDLRVHSSYVQRLSGWQALAPLKFSDELPYATTSLTLRLHPAPLHHSRNSPP